jgi:arginine exporter protein ArgO
VENSTKAHLAVMYLSGVATIVAVTVLPINIGSWVGILTLIVFAVMALKTAWRVKV